MKTTIVYLHGWGSTPESTTAQDIKQSFPDETFLCPHLHHEQDPLVTRKQMDELGKKLMGQHDAIVVGSSAGGFWADYIGAVYGIKTVLINPSLKPSVNFKKYKLPAEYYDHYKELEDFVKTHTRHHMVAFAGEKDRVVPIEHVKTHYKQPIVLKGEEHRVKNLSPIVKMVKSMIGNFPEHH